MPAGTDTDSQFRFLISCIRHSSAGKVDFEEVRKECDIISKGAAAKRYERLMKAHGIAPNSAANGVKKEDKDPETPKKAKSRATKKRKLQEVDEDETDVEEPIKEEVIKGEFKHEDAIVKTECPNNHLSSATPLYHVPSHSESTSPSTNIQTDDDDEVLFVSATEKQLTPIPPTYLSDDRHSHTYSRMSATPAIHSVESAANIGFLQHLAAPSSQSPTPPMETMRSSDSFSYGYTPTTWMFPHESHGYL
ncbi:hypothetical protein F5B22DRAFT_654191 [Xylaria bambusicola]|uniref:uncharacterized protein n=1 Tax=Xylaria bambusicola TaxID=326684 RepID=UPI002007F57A|nr:uncharacterized protein F5B22DRAFT_654191 [Xylaria bambusicola]KAI0518293.1 hypothetical protein F5B22DRAFT_654191 [Xylaria bambusicola]